ncbi:hypothetical protein MSPP1_001808 [Malassezia sp. CBS 17886]|nr:hypothetical protein MSPP1_001808 [Malassezia sp. CBS 17886]
MWAPSAGAAEERGEARADEGVGAPIPHPRDARSSGAPLGGAATAPPVRNPPTSPGPGPRDAAVYMSSAPRRAAVGRPRKRGRPPRSASLTRADPPPEPPPRSTAAPESGASPLSPPALAFQCVGCRSIVGDSFSWATAQRRLSLIVLHEATDRVEVRPPLVVSADGEPCAGSTYVRLHCAQCGRSLGRMYRSTPRDLDELRDAFSFFVDAVTVYQLGSTSAGAARQSSPSLAGGAGRMVPGADAQRVSPSPGDHVPTRVSQPASVVLPAGTPAMYRVPLADGESDKIRTLLMAMGERLMRVERILNLLPEGAGDDVAPGIPRPPG